MLDPADPMTIGAMVGPEAFFEVRYLAHAKQMEALDLIPGIAQRFAVDFGRPSGGLEAGGILWESFAVQLVQRAHARGRRAAAGQPAEVAG